MLIFPLLLSTLTLFLAAADNKDRKNKKIREIRGLK